jgi:hypothetical protein
MIDLLLVINLSVIFISSSWKPIILCLFKHWFLLEDHVILRMEISDKQWGETTVVISRCLSFRLEGLRLHQFLVLAVLLIGLQNVEEVLKDLLFQLWSHALIMLSVKLRLVKHMPSLNSDLSPIWLMPDGCLLRGVLRLNHPFLRILWVDRSWPILIAFTLSSFVARMKTVELSFSVESCLKLQWKLKRVQRFLEVLVFLWNKRQKVKWRVIFQFMGN